MIVCVSGTGTEIGKTHLGCALVGALVDRGLRVVPWKPVESGVPDPQVAGADEAALAAAAGRTSPVPTLRLREPLSPHLAARRQGVTIDAAMLRRQLAVLEASTEVLHLELAGGLFSPFDDERDNADWLAGTGARVVLVAPDRLGVLHDVGAALRAAASAGVTIAAVALVAPASADAASGSNAAELRARPTTRAVPVFEIPRGAVDALRTSAAVQALAAHLVPAK